jgi:CBS-domain-containing membrane protein
MSRDVKVVRRNDQLALADDLMKQARIRHLPVLDENGVVCAVVTSGISSAALSCRRWATAGGPRI